MQLRVLHLIEQFFDRECGPLLHLPWARRQLRKLAAESVEWDQTDTPTECLRLHLENLEEPIHKKENENFLWQIPMHNPIETTVI